MSRRTGGLRRALGAILAIGLVAAGCGGTDSENRSAGVDPGEDPPADGSSAAGSPDGGGAADPDGSLRVAYAGPQDTLDPHLSIIPTFAVYQYPIYDRLFLIDSTSSVQPMLATDFSFADDGSSMELTLRDDAVFHDGTPVDAEAVKASIERAKTIEGSSVAGELEGVTAVEVVDDHTVRFELDGAGPELPATLGTNAGSILNPVVIDDPAADLDAAPPPGAGSGPYVVVESEPNVFASYEAAPEYWDDGAGRLAELTVTFVAQAPSRLAGLQAGDFDLVQVTGDVFDQATADADAGVYEMTTSPASTRDIFFNIESGDLADPDVRRAIDLAIDPEAVSVVSPCETHTQPQFEGHWAYDDEIENPYDPDEARSIIDARGGASFDVLVASGSSYEPVATVVQGQLSDVGIDMSIVPVEQSQTTPMMAAGEAQAIMSSLVPGADPAQTLDRYFFGGAHLARGDLAEELADPAAAALDPSLSQDDRAAIYRDVFARIADAHLYAPICRGLQGWAHTLPIVGLDDMPGLDGGLPDLTRLAVAAG